ncbi:hypothetical protein AMATHDRAFT_68357 [Amanita thiersii Skay4041]|uniref:Uncharacterized protein n=1 Tax=Amanita thiersii Skay4041 TaxID=703135 RepID=A0A2A9NCV4_9AGAR|nr:hypothetical protein AMATHDRAFT_68357 [Amanita thiersii Skay4041]
MPQIYKLTVQEQGPQALPSFHADGCEVKANLLFLKTTSSMEISVKRKSEILGFSGSNVWPDS